MNSVERFNERAAREPPLWRKAALLVLAVALPIWLGSERGLGVGIVAAVVYGTLFGLGALRHHQMLEWSRSHPYLDLLWMPALAFLALAALTHLPLGLCVVIAIGAGGVFAVLAVVLWRRRASP